MCILDVKSNASFGPMTCPLPVLAGFAPAIHGLSSTSGADGNRGATLAPASAPSWSFTARSSPRDEAAAEVPSAPPQRTAPLRHRVERSPLERSADRLIRLLEQQTGGSAEAKDSRPWASATFIGQSLSCFLRAEGTPSLAALQEQQVALENGDYPLIGHCVAELCATPIAQGESATGWRIDALILQDA